MNGTLALWYDKNEDASSQAPEVELHFNLWRDLQSSLETNFLDIGFRFPGKIDAVKQFYLYIPCRIKNEHLEDLSKVLKYGQTLDAVFNTVVKLGEQGEGYYRTTSDDPKSDQRAHFTTVHSIEIGEQKDIWVEELENDDQTTGSSIIFSESLCEKIKLAQTENAENAYLRIRLHLKGDSSELFSQELNLGDQFTVASVGKLEITEFRFNEERSYPNRITELARRGRFHVRTVHYFLIRDLRHQLSMQHKTFKKVRRLEGKLWRHYLLGYTTSDRIADYQKLADRMVIYHWREQKDGTNSIDDFVAFASFQASLPNLWLYIFAAVLIGAVGSIVAGSVAKVLVELIPSLSTYVSGIFLQLSEATNVSSSLDQTEPTTTGVLFDMVVIAVILLILWAIWQLWKPVRRATRKVKNMFVKVRRSMMKHTRG